MARARGLEPLSYGFGDRYVTITPSPYIRRIEIIAAALSDIIQRQ